VNDSIFICVDKATNPLNQSDDFDSIMAFCKQVNDELEGPQIGARLLSHKIQSPQEKEAFKRLNG
jgi:ADP-ribosylation factor-binding protein GGA